MKEIRTKLTAFYLGYEWHNTILLPIQSELQKSGTETAVFDSLDELKSWRPAVTVVADASFIDNRMRKAEINSIFVHVCHGLISKNIPELSYKFVDYICAPSPFWINILKNREIRPKKEYWPTGMVQMDALFKELASGRTTKQARLEFPHFPVQFNRERQLVLYAPTWNPSLTSAEMIFDNGLAESFWNGETQGKFSLVIKPHPHIAKASPQWIERWQQYADRNPSDIFLVTPASGSLAPFIPLADLMVSDCSSAIFHFLATGRPQVLVDNPKRFDTPQCFDPNGLEWTWRDMGYRVENAGEISAVLARLLEGKDENLHIRRERRDIFFGEYTDGKAASRIASRLLALR